MIVILADTFLVWLFLGWMAATTVSVACAVATEYGLGKHRQLQTHSMFAPYQQLVLVTNFFYYGGNTLVKLSLLAFYLRVERGRKQRYFIFAMFFVVGGFGFGRCVACLCQCIPLTKLWNPKEAGHCFSLIPALYANSAIMFVTDIIIYLMPLEYVSHLEMERKKKWGMMGLFSLGLL